MELSAYTTLYGRKDLLISCLLSFKRSRLRLVKRRFAELRNLKNQTSKGPIVQEDHQPLQNARLEAM